MTIDNLIPESWPEDIVTALDAWRQGHLVEGDLGTWLSAAGRYDPVTGDHFPDGESRLVAAASEVGDAGYLAIVSQTCDIAATGPGARHPFVQVCPVRDVGAVFSPAKVQQIRSGQIVEYVYLTKPPVSGKDWAVDLRMSIPLSKGALVAAQPVEGFANEDDELALAARVATKFERPALHDYLSKNLIDALEDLLSKARRGQDWCDDVEQLRLQVAGNRLAPQRVRLIVVTDIDFNGILITKKKPLRDLWKSHRKALRNLGIEQDPIAFRTLDKMSITDYRNSIPLNLKALGRENFA